MFSLVRYLKLRMFIAKVQAEIMAQCGNQELVNKICQYPEIIEELDVIRRTSYYRKDKNAPFLTACYVLGSALDVYYFDDDLKKKCLYLLISRLNKARENPHFSQRHFHIFSDLEEKADSYIEKYDLFSLKEVTVSSPHFS